MWKDYLYLNKRERSAFWTFTMLIAVAQVAIWTGSYWMPVLTKAIRSERTLHHNSMTTQCNPTESMATRQKDEKRTGYRTQDNVKKAIVLSSFNPNTADSATLVSLGIKPYVAKNIVKYRKKGGQFRKPEDLARIYGLEPSVFNTLLPFIEIGLKDKQEERNSSAGMAEGTAVLTDSPGVMADETAVLTDSFQPFQTVPLAGFELNAADTSTLQLLKGVGTVTAMRIVRYGNQLGGYHAVSQLSEISGIYPTVLASLQKSLTVDASLIRKINVNKASLERLRAHPYLDFYQAKTIIGLRTARKGINNLSELSEFKEFTKEDLERLKWYLAF